VNIPLLKIDPNLTLSVLASPPETRIASGGTESVSGSASGTASKSYDSQQSLSALSGCDGDTFIAGLVTMGFTQIQGSPVRGNFGGKVVANTMVSAIYEYEPVPEPMTAVGTFVAAGMGLWWKRMASKKV
jgi:hypothetical protein